MQGYKRQQTLSIPFKKNGKFPEVKFRLKCKRIYFIDDCMNVELFEMKEPNMFGNVTIYRSTMQEYLKRHEEKEAEKKGFKTASETSAANGSGVNPWNKQDTFPSENFAFYIWEKYYDLLLPKKLPSFKVSFQMA